jgi:hypothetical protein
MLLKDFLDVITLDQRTPELKEKSLARIEILTTSWNEIENKQIATTPSIPIESESHSSPYQIWSNPWIMEFMVLWDRNIKDVLRDKAALGATFGQAIFLVILLGFIFWQLPLTLDGQQSRFGFLFFIIINRNYIIFQVCPQFPFLIISYIETFGIVMPFIGVFPEVKAIFKRERNSGTYRASTAYFSKVASNLPLTWANSIIFSVGLYWMVGLQANAALFFTFVLIILVHSTTALAFAFFIGSIVPTAQVGQILAPLIISIFLVNAL